MYFKGVISGHDMYKVSTCKINHMWIRGNPSGDKANIGSGHGLVPLGNKPIPEPMLTQTYDVKWNHQASMSSAYPMISGYEW